MTVTIQENAVKETFCRRFAMPLDFDFLKYPVYPYGLKQDLIVRLQLNSSEKVIWVAKISTIGELHAGTTLIPFNKVTIPSNTLSKRDTTWRIKPVCLVISKFSVAMP